MGHKSGQKKSGQPYEKRTVDRFFCVPKKIYLGSLYGSEQFQKAVFLVLVSYISRIIQIHEILRGITV